jgi:hypothetical protein
MLGFTQALTEMRTGRLWDIARPVYKVDNLTAIYEPIV